MTMQDVYAYIDANLDAAVGQLLEYSRLPTVSAQASAIDETAAFTADLLRAEGFDVQILPKQNGAFPVVYAEHAGRRADKTLLFYNHYDVQPPDPLDEWTSPAFEPVRRGESIYGRGVSDDKGN